MAGISRNDAADPMAVIIQPRFPQRTKPYVEHVQVNGGGQAVIGNVKKSEA